MQAMSTIPDPELAPPGAGLPPLELFVARRLFRLKRLLGSRESFLDRFQRERSSIRELLATCPPSRRGERVLIPRLRGLEDSSRHWSLWMTLDHLRITNGVFAVVMASLARGRVPSRPASTAAVKPDLEADASVEAGFEESCDRLLATVAGVADLRTSARYAHPWFGRLDAEGWWALSAMHMGIHRGQVARILAGLRS
jgi:hypothetical protein